jgi:hypothetical protein
MGRVLRALVLVGLAVTFFALAVLVLSEAGAQEEPCCAFSPVPVFEDSAGRVGW